jgi:hypothetical protein
MKIEKLAACSLTVFALAGLSMSQEAKQQDGKALSASKAPAVLPANSGETNRFKVIGYLETRDRVITIKSGPNGTVYSVATKEGQVLHENLSAEQLKAQAPELHEFIKTATAGDARLRIVR